MLLSTLKREGRGSHLRPTGNFSAIYKKNVLRRNRNAQLRRVHSSRTNLVKSAPAILALESTASCRFEKGRLAPADASTIAASVTVQRWNMEQGETSNQRSVGRLQRAQPTPQS
eukprot:871274-Pleurochrysis_carterae.AAC.3